MLITISLYLILALATFLMNIPFGYLKEKCQKYSAGWFLWSYAFIPVVLGLCQACSVSKLFIIPAFFFAIAGQKAGIRYRKNQLTVADREQMEQIPDLKLAQPAASANDEQISVLLLNMGGPKDIAEVRPFLKRLFMDDLIIRFPLAPLTQNFFADLIVRLRGKEAEKRYTLIGGGSPIYRSTAAQTAALQSELDRRGRRLKVTFSFNYSEPFPETAIKEIKTSGKKYILPLSLYPHYSLATSGSNMHYLRKAAQANYPEVRFLQSGAYYLADSYINAFVDRINEQLKPGESLDDFYLLFSAHGLPLYFLTQGDPYPFEIAQTVSKIVDRLKREDNWVVSYQSAVGPMQWLKPSTEAMLQALARRGIKKILVVPISFVTDHIETICEIDIEYRHLADGLGINDFRMSRAIECHPGFINALADCVEKSLGANRSQPDAVPAYQGGLK